MFQMYLFVILNEKLCAPNSDRLSASDMILVRKVIEHVYEKMLGQGSDAGSQTAGGTNSNSAANPNSQQERSETDRDEDWSSMAEEKIELLCNDQVNIYVVCL